MCTAPTRWFDTKLPFRKISLTEAADFQASASLEQTSRLCEEALAEIRSQKQNYIHDNANYVPLSVDSTAGIQVRSLSAKDRLASAAQLITSNKAPSLIPDALRDLTALLKNKSTPFHSLVCGTLTELLTAYCIVPGKRKLRDFHQQPHHFIPMKESNVQRKIVLCNWYLEHEIKNAFSDLLNTLNAELQSHHTIESRRLNVLRLLGKMLQQLPEELNRICQIIVNKLGDPSTLLSARAAAILLDFIHRHSNQQEIVATELESFLLRPNMGSKAQTLAIHVLNQLIFSPNAPKLPVSVLKVYFALFRTYVGKAEAGRRIMNGILIGIKRAVPYVLSFRDLGTHLDTLFTMASASSAFPIRVTALHLLLIITAQCAVKNRATVLPRFYRSLYQLAMFDPSRMPHSTHLTLFFSLLYKALRRLEDHTALAAFVHRMLQTALINTSAYACATLLMISEIQKANPPLREIIIGKARTKSLRGKNKDTVVPSNRFPASTCTEDEISPITRETGSKLDSHSSKHCNLMYNRFHRDPVYSGASLEPLWEIRRLERHFHPAVVKFATMLRLGVEIIHSGHPLDDFGVIHFCDLFVNKKPQKRIRESRSVHERVAAAKGTTGHGISSSSVASSSLEVEKLFIKKYDDQKPKSYKKASPSQDEYSREIDLEKVCDANSDTHSKTLPISKVEKKCKRLAKYASLESVADDNQFSHSEDFLNLEVGLPSEIKKLLMYSSYEPLDGTLARDIETDLFNETNSTRMATKDRILRQEEASIKDRMSLRL